MSTALIPSATGSRKPLGIAAVTACAVLWSTGGLFIKLVPWNPLAIAGGRSLLGALVILAWLRKPKLSWSATQLGTAFTYAATMIGFVTANKLTTAANAILLQYTAPVFAAVLAVPILKERTRWFDWLTIAITLGGLTLFFLDRLSGGGALGNIIGVASGLLFAVSVVLLRKQKEGSSLESMMMAHFIAFFVSIPFLWRELARGMAPADVAPGAALVSWGSLAFLGLFQQGTASILLAYGLKHLTAVQSFFILMIEPILNPLLVFVFLGEAPGPYALAGGAIILGATTIRTLVPLVGGRREAVRI